MTVTAGGRVPAVRTPADLAPAALTFLGGAGTVTGSKTLLDVGSRSVLIDCGLFQGSHDLRLRNWQELGAAPSRIGAVVLTHAHLDHCGYVPKLCRDGFTGSVLATRETADLVEVVLLDSAHLLEEEAQHAATHGWSKHPLPRALYTTENAQRAVRRLTPVRFDAGVEVVDGISCTWRPAGHILGSATVHLEVEGGPSVLFTGDLGRQGHPLLRPPAPPPAADVVVVESTYGDRKHERRDPARLADAINRTVARGGSVLIPAFAVDRTEVLLCALKVLFDEGAIPRIPVFVDSPMALRALGIYREALDRQDPDVRSVGDDPFGLNHLQALTTVEQSMTVNSPQYPSIVISASGMASGGRVLHHLKHQLPDPRNTVVLVGFQAAGTRGRLLQEGARSVKIHGQYVPVRAEIVDLEEYSVHADADDVLAWLGSMPAAPGSCYITHGEPDASAALRRRIEDELGWLAVVPRTGERVLCA